LPRFLSRLEAAPTKMDSELTTDSALLTDLYQLTMLQGYFDRDMHDEAVFELFVRRLPAERNFLMAAGLEQALDYLATLRFSAEDIESLAATRLFSSEFLRWLENLRFTGDVEAMREGTIFFADEPVLRVTAPLPQAQFVESRLINILHFQTLVASKAARCVLAAQGRQLVDFGMRRAHGSEAAVLAARASFLAGFAGTSNVLAKQWFDIPIAGTMAHSFVQAHDTEEEAFEHFAQSQTGPIVLLVDTYDTETGVRRVIDLARRSPDTRIDAIRLDSGDLGALSMRARAILDEAGFEAIEIFASGSLDERRIEDLVARHAPIDGFGVGTSLDVSEDCPALDIVYKLQEYAGQPRRKRSAGKATWPGRKQIFRRSSDTGCMDGDTITLDSEPEPGESLLHAVMRDGVSLESVASLLDARAHAGRELARLPPRLRALEAADAYDVEVAPALKRLAKEVDSRFD
jgi:nicotinate phosphoribosyltransferase